MKLCDIMYSLKNAEQAMNLSRFFKTGKGQYGEGDKFLGIKVPVTRQVVKENWQSASMDELQEMLRNEYHEIRLCALLVLVQIYKHAKKKPELRQQCVDFYLANTQYINNWDLVDLSCYEILGNWLLDKERTVLYRLAKNGRSIWEQRIGIVSCMALIRNNELDDMFAIADILLYHEHDLIHKAVGWLLREAGKHDESILRNYLDTCPEGENMSRYQVMPRTMLRYAIEKFPEDLRQRYLKGDV